MQGKLGWHADRIQGLTPDEQNRVVDPIISVSLGCQCKFGYKDFKGEQQDLLLESGDIIIWGGPARMMFHTVHRIYTNTTPSGKFWIWFL